MIGLIQGQVVHLSAPMACVLTDLGIGYEIELPVPAFCTLQLNTETKIWTHLHVREDAQLLYGFNTPRDRMVFRQLIKINGVGAKMALAMLSNLSVAELKNCVEMEDEATLVRIPGVGKKTAQRLLIELKDRLKDIELSADELPLVSSDSEKVVNQSLSAICTETKMALLGLGYKEKEAEQAIKLAQEQSDEFADTQSLLKASLQQLSK